MKTMTLTGLATEQSFNQDGVRYYLVFNNGELRVPVPEEAAEAVISALADGKEVPAPSYASNGSGDDDFVDDDDDGVAQV